MVIIWVGRRQFILFVVGFLFKIKNQFLFATLTSLINQARNKIDFLFQNTKSNHKRQKTKVKMNIFALHKNPRKSARWHADKHVVKMLLESVQMLYTSHWVLAYPLLLKQKSPLTVSRFQKTLSTPPLLDLYNAPPQISNPEQKGYRPVHVHHPCTKWVSSSLGNYMWLCHLALHLAEEFRFRWPNSGAHSCEAHVKWLIEHPPIKLKINKSPLTPFAEAMPDEYKKSDPIGSYRAFYKGSKTDRGITNRYTTRQRPHWLS